MAQPELFTAGRAVLQTGGCVEPPARAPVIRGRPQLVGAEGPELPATLASPRPDFPLLATPAPGTERVDVKEWGAAARRLLDARLHESGAVLLRGLPLGSRADFSELLRAIGYEPMHYVGVATREEVAPGVFTTNAGSPGRTIMLHNEMAAEPVIPGHAFLFCEAAPPDGAGGETPIALNRDWNRALGPSLLERFERRGLVRHYRVPDRGDRSSTRASWQERYGTDDRDAVDAVCARVGDVATWGEDGTLDLRRSLDALIEHRGERLWFGTLPNARPVTSLEMEYADDGVPVEPEMIALARAVQWRIAVAFSWRRGDVLCLDNLGCQHGRLSVSEGVDRRIFVSIATPVRGVVRMPGISA